MKSRIEQRDELIMQFGMLVAPIRRAFSELGLKSEAAPYLESHFRADRSRFEGAVRTFCRAGDHDFAHEYGEVHGTIYPLKAYYRRMVQPSANIDALQQEFSRDCARVLDAIRAIPCDDPDTILPAASPFQTYMRLRAHCTGVTSRLEIFDPYLDPSVFHLYAGEVPASATLTIVTDYGNQSSPMTKPAKRAAIVAVSELVARERKDKYRFYVATSMHDRYLRADDTILHLGGSLAHAGRNDPFAISKLDPTAATHGMLDKIIAGADEWYGPNVTTHKPA